MNRMKTWMKATLIFLYLPLICQLILISAGTRFVWPDFFPMEWTMRAWKSALSNNQLWLSFTNSLSLAFAVTVLAILLSIPFSLKLYQIRSSKPKLGHLIEVLSMIPLFTPLLLPAFGLYEIMVSTQLIGTFWGLVLVQTIPLIPYMLRTLNDEMNLNQFKFEQQALALGESSRRIFWKVTLPRLFPALLAGSIFVFSGSFNDYLLPFLIGESRIQTLSLSLFPLMKGDDRSLAAIYSIFYILPFFIFVPSSHKKSYQ